MNSRDPSSPSATETIIGVLVFGFVIYTAASEGRLGALVIDILGPIAFIVGGLSIIALLIGKLSFKSFSVIASIILSFLAVADGSFSVEWVLTCSASWAIACFLLKRGSAGEKHEDVESVFAKKGFELAVVVATASAIASLLAQHFNRFRPEHLLLWREQIKSAVEILRLVKLGTAQSLVILGLLFLLQRYYSDSRLTKWCLGVWRAWTPGSRWLKRFTLVLSILFCFSVVSGRPGGVMQELQDLIRNADHEYAEAVWRCELHLRAELRIEVYREVLSTLSSEVQTAVDREAQINAVARATPEFYLDANKASGSKNDTTEDFERGLEGREHELLGLLPDTPTPDHAAPNSATLSDIERLEADSKQLEKSNEPPEWMRGIGEEILKKLLSSAPTIDLSPFLARLKEEWPLAGQLIELADSALRAPLEEKLNDAAVRMAREQLENPRQSMESRLRLAMTTIGIQRVPTLMDSVFRTQARASEVRAELVEGAYARFEEDEVKEIATITKRLKVEREALKGLNGQATSEKPESDVDQGDNLPAGGFVVSKLNELRREEHELIEQIARSSGASDLSKARNSLGEDVYSRVLSEHENQQRESSRLGPRGIERERFEPRMHGIP